MRQMRSQGGAAAGMALFQSAGAGCRQHLRGTQATVWVERVAESCHGRQIVVVEQLTHEADLLDADPMFASHAPTAGNAFVENLAARLEHPLHLFGISL